MTNDDKKNQQLPNHATAHLVGSKLWLGCFFNEAFYFISLVSNEEQKTNIKIWITSRKSIEMQTMEATLYLFF